MTDFLIYIRFSKPFERDSRQPGLTATQADEAKGAGSSPTELMRSIARWENEGGAVPA